MVKVIELQIDNAEQPQPHYRFRYPTEGQSGAILTSVGSGKSTRSFPQLKVLHYVGWVRVRCSCVTASGPPHRPHPFRLAGQSCTDGVFEVDWLITESDRRVPLRNVGVQCVKLRDLRDPKLLLSCFEERRKRNVNPFNTSWDQFDVKQDSHCVRLCFEVTAIKCNGGEPLQDIKAVPPIITNVIHGKLTSDDLKIYHISLSKAPATGNCELIILCSKVQANDIQIRFYDERTKWSEVVEVRSSDVHKQYAMRTHVPRFQDVNIVKPVSIRIQLIRPSSGEHSRPVSFQYIPTVAATAQPCDASVAASNAYPYERRKRLRSDVMMSNSIRNNHASSSLSASSDAESSSIFYCSESSALPPPSGDHNLRKRKIIDKPPELDCLSNSAIMKSMIGKRLKNRIKAKGEHKSAQSEPKDQDGAESSSEPASGTELYNSDVLNNVHVPDASVNNQKETATTAESGLERSSYASSGRTQFNTIDYSDEAGSTSYVTTLSNSSVQSSTGATIFMGNTGDLNSMRYLLSSDDSDIASPVVTMLVMPAAFVSFPEGQIPQNLLTTESLPAAALSGLMALSGAPTETSTTTIATSVFDLNHVGLAKHGYVYGTLAGQSDVVTLEVNASDVVIEKISDVQGEKS